MHAPLTPLLSPFPGALRLAGQDIWFSEVEEAGARRAVSDLPGDLNEALTAPRAPVCGLAMDRPRIMGILNVTPDSFSDGGDFAAPEAALAQARALADVSDIIDIGGESTRPGSDEVPEAEEIARTVPVIAAIRDAGITTPISIDTRKAAVAEAALDAGADIVNDVAAFTFDPALADLVAERGVPVCLMHAQGLPDTMQENPHYGDVQAEVYHHLAERIEFAAACGIAHEAIIADPGIGFGKTTTHNLVLMRHLAAFHGLGVPLLLGASRKRFIGEIGGGAEPKARMPGSVSVALWAAAQGAQIIRVHDAAETRQALDLWQAMEKGKTGETA